MYIYGNIQLNVFRMNNFSAKIFRENQNTFMYTIPPPSRTFYEIMWKNVGESDRPQMTIKHGACDFKATKTHSEYATVVAWA